MPHAIQRDIWVYVIYVWTCVCALLLPSISLAQSPTSLEDVGVSSGELQKIIATSLDDNNLPSLSVAIVIDKTIVFSHAIGYSDLAESLHATPKTIYRIGSVTKPITVTMLVKLAEEGVLRLDDPVSEYLPEYRVKSRFSDTQQTTLRQLASHQSGLPRNTPHGFLVDLAYHRWIVEGQELILPQRTREQFVASLSELELEYPPYDVFGHYSNLGFKILGLALESASGENFDDYVTKNILLPLGMTRSGFNPINLPTDAMAIGYIYREANPEPLIAQVSEPGLGIYAGGMYSTSEDLCQFLSLQFQTNDSGGAQVISSDGLRMMQWTAMDWAFTWDRKYPALEHGGGVPGFSTHVIIIPGLKLGIAVLSNTMNVLKSQNPCKSIAWDIVNKLKSGIIAQIDISSGADTVSLGDYIGTYVLSDNLAQIDISLSNDTLIYHLEGLEESEGRLYKCSKNTLCFERDINKVYMLVFDQFLNSKPNRLSIGEYHFSRVKSD